MLILSVDTSTRAYSLAVLRDATVLGTARNVDTGEVYSSRLFRDVEELLAQTRVALADIDLFAVAAGPGSFTGLRVGLTAVKAWAELFGMPVAAVSGLEAVAAQAEAPVGGIVAPVVDARRGQVYGAIYRQRDGAALELVGEQVVEGAEEFLARVAAQSDGSEPLIVTPTPEVIQPALEKSAWRAARVQQVSLELAPVIGRLGYVRALRGEVVDAITLDANYVRRTDAEAKWKEG